MTLQFHSVLDLFHTSALENIISHYINDQTSKTEVKYFAWCYLEGQGKSKKLMTILPEFNAELFLFMDSSLVYSVTMHPVQFNIFLSTFTFPPCQHVKTHTDHAKHLPKCCSNNCEQ